MGNATITCAVLLPVYSGDSIERFRESFYSIRDAYAHSFERRIVVCIDGPLRPDVRAFIQSHARDIHAIIESADNLGLPKILNIAIQEIGPVTYIARMDADDISHQDRFERQIEFLDKNPSVDAVGCAIIERHLVSNKRVLRNFPAAANIPEAICKGVPIAHPTAMFRGDFFNRFGSYPEARSCQDIGLWFSALRQGAKLDNIQDALLTFNIDRTFYGRRALSKAFEEFNIYLYGILGIYGLNWRLIYPIGRLALRLVPESISRMVYESGHFRNGSVAKIVPE